MAIPALPAGSPVWLTVLVVLVFVLGTLTKQAASLGLPVAKWWNTRQEREVDRAMTLEERIIEAAEQRAEAKVSPLRCEMAQMREAFDHLRAELREEQSRSAEAFDYIEYCVKWSRDVRVIVAALVPPVVLPRFLSLAEWREQGRPEPAPPMSEPPDT